MIIGADIGGKMLFADALPDGLCTGEELPEALCSSVVPMDTLVAELNGLHIMDECHRQVGLIYPFERE